MEHYDVIVLGGGAAGLMCAAVAGARGRRVLVLEGSNKVGKKILMSGGGRCNFTNLNSTPSNFISANPHFCKSALSRYTPFDFLTLVEAYGIGYHEKTAGQLFCDHSAKAIVTLLLTECERAGVRITTHSPVRAVTYAGCYRVLMDLGVLEASSLVVATGGLSIPKMGATDFGYRVARQFGLDVLDTRPGLVPFTLSGRSRELSTRLTGVSAAVLAATNGVHFEDEILFTHRGLSGPAALQLSSYWSVGQSITINLLPKTTLEALLLEAKRSQPRVLLRTVLSQHLVRALVQELQHLFWADVAEWPLAVLSDDQLRDIASQLQRWVLEPSGTEGYRTAEVTLGGVDTAELSSRTMEAKRQPGLYCIGEVIDVTGHLGGHNFQWAWASAQAAGQVA
ncbi:MAG: NAD(P)/FAD-dependent oxidoreductase [Gammaproteobacteria bacterium]